MTEPLNITLDRLSEQYDTLKRRCESTERPNHEDVKEILGVIKELNAFGLEIKVPMCVWKTPLEISRSDRIADYSVPNVTYQGRGRDVTITVKPLDNGAEREQHEWVAAYANGIDGKTGIPDTQIFFQTIKTVYDRQQDRFSDIAAVLRDSISVGVITSTAINQQYITHQIGTIYERVQYYGERSRPIRGYEGPFTVENLAGMRCQELEDAVAWIMGPGCTGVELSLSEIVGETTTVPVAITKFVEGNGSRHRVRIAIGHRKARAYGFKLSS